jgi:hypothetical protein
MAAEDFAFNISKGRYVEFYNRVENNDPASSGFILVPLSVGGTAAQGRDFDTLAAVLADANFDEAGASWGRKTLTDAQLAALPAPDDTNDRYAIPLPVVTWTAPTAGQNVVQILVCYDPDTTSGTDSAIIPISAHAVSITPDGVNDEVMNAGDFIRDT